MNPAAESRGLQRARGKFVIWGIAACILVSATAVAIWMLTGQRWSGRGPYTIGWTNDPPEMLPDSNGQPTGVAVETVREAARRRGIPLKWVRHDEGSEAALRSGSVDIWPLMTITPERLKVLHISAPYLDSVVSFIVRKGSPLRRLEDLSGQTVGYVSMHHPGNGPPGNGPLPINMRLARQ